MSGTSDLERVAKALFELEWTVDGKQISTWRKGDPDNDYWYACARAALSAIREPSEEMLAEMDSAIPRFEPVDGVRMMGRDGAELAWHAAIDHALGTKQS